MERFMKLAVDSARKGIRQNHGGPFGACVIQNKKVISVAHNTVLGDHDPTCHAEMNAIREACKKLKTHDLSQCELYTTAEPCPMCLAAIYWARIPVIHVGVPKEVAAHYGFDDSRFYKELRLPTKKRALVQKNGVLKKACEEVFKNWKQRKGSLY